MQGRTDIEGLYARRARALTPRPVCPLPLSPLQFLVSLHNGYKSLAGCHGQVERDAWVPHQPPLKEGRVGKVGKEQILPSTWEQFPVGGKHFHTPGRHKGGCLGAALTEGQATSGPVSSL